MSKRAPTDVMPPAVARALTADPYWFVIGGHAVRCFCPYRPSVDVDLGVESARDAETLLRKLRRKGRVEIIERTEETIHLLFEGLDVSIFVLSELLPFSEEHALTLDGVLATKLHAILDRGTRRDFFDLYVVLERHRLGIAECLRALREVYGADLNEGLMLRALVYFDDATAEAPLPGEGEKDWAQVQAFFQSRVGALLTPPAEPLAIQANVVDVCDAGSHNSKPRSPPVRRGKRKR